MGLRLCLGKEWYRYQSSFLVPDEVEIRWVKSDFGGILPKNWIDERNGRGGGLWGRSTDKIPTEMNNRNLEETSRYVSLDTCDYFIDLSYPHRTPTPTSSPEYFEEKDWDKVSCEPFLDLERSERGWRSWGVIRVGKEEGGRLKWGEYCLLRRSNGKAGILSK